MTVTGTDRGLAGKKGDFRFTQLGPGRRTIAINAPGYKPVRFNHDTDTHRFERRLL